MSTRIQEGERASTQTTLYDLLEAIHTAVEPEDEDRIVAAVVHMLRAQEVVWHGQFRQDLKAMPASPPPVYEDSCQ